MRDSFEDSDDYSDYTDDDTDDYVSNDEVNTDDDDEVEKEGESSSLPSNHDDKDTLNDNKAPTEKSDEELARELQNQYDAEDAAASSFE